MEGVSLASREHVAQCDDNINEDMRQRTVNRL